MNPAAAMKPDGNVLRGKKGEMNYEKEERFSQENLTVGSAGGFQRAGILLRRKRKNHRRLRGIKDGFVQ